MFLNIWSLDCLITLQFFLLLFSLFLHHVFLFFSLSSFLFFAQSEETRDTESGKHDFFHFGCLFECGCHS